MSRPRWLDEIDQSLAVASQFILVGNIRDTFLLPGPNEGDPPTMADVHGAVWSVLRDAGYAALLTFDVIDGLRCQPDPGQEPAVQTFLTQTPAVVAQSLNNRISRERLAEIITAVTQQADGRGALLIDYADRLVVNPPELEESEHELFALAQKRSYAARAHVAEGRAPLFNPVFWLVPNERDLPSWFHSGNTRVRIVDIPFPEFSQRSQVATSMLLSFGDFVGFPEERRQAAVERLAESTEGMNVAQMSNVTVLALDRGIGVQDIDDAARTYRAGVDENPWKQAPIRARIADGRAAIEERVKGQGDAVQKALDILVRSSTGLTGANTSANSTKPRGVLFFAGPTGVGKTEMAKALTELVFGDESAYVRLDMSEYSSEFAETRLIGSPPGYVGHDAGGQLTDAVRRRPFSLVLFDEIEKAHPRILDKFLQVLEDGRLTDGMGNTVYFSETILVFTSNLGIMVEDEHGQRVANVTRADDRETFEQKIRVAIDDHFKYELGRPELLNRFGDNIVVFDFIDETTGRAIFEGQLRNVVARVAQEYRATLVVEEPVIELIWETARLRLDQGGRGIGTVLESTLVNPLARSLFASPPDAGTEVRVVGARADGRNWELELAQG